MDNGAGVVFPQGKSWALAQKSRVLSAETAFQTNYCDSDSSSADIKHKAKTCKADSKELL